MVRGDQLRAAAVGAATAIVGAGALLSTVARADDDTRDKGGANEPGQADAGAGAPKLAPFEVPWQPTEVQVRRRDSVLRTAALGRPDRRIRRFRTAKRSARQDGRERALERIHQFVDEALAEKYADPRTAEAVHRALDRDARVVGIRALVDGAAVVVVDVPLEALRSRTASKDYPWHE
jgi:hypothetical protein